MKTPSLGIPAFPLTFQKNILLVFQNSDRLDDDLSFPRLQIAFIEPHRKTDKVSGRKRGILLNHNKIFS